MANIYDSKISCADKKALKKVTKLILKLTPSEVRSKSDNIVVFETQWKDLDYAMEVFSRNFPEVNFSCSFIHITSSYEYYYTNKDYKNGIVTFNGLKPAFLYNLKGLENINLNDYSDFVSRFTSFFTTMYEERKYEDGRYWLEFIPDRYRSKNEAFSLQAKAEYDEYFLIATLSSYSDIKLEVVNKEKKLIVEPIANLSEEYDELPF